MKNRIAPIVAAASVAVIATSGSTVYAHDPAPVVGPWVSTGGPTTAGGAPGKGAWTYADPGDPVVSDPVVTSVEDVDPYHDAAHAATITKEERTTTTSQQAINPGGQMPGTDRFDQTTTLTETRTTVDVYHDGPQNNP